MTAQNQNRIIVDDAKERAQLEKTQQTIEEQRKEILKQKYIQKQMKKYKLFRFSNWLLWIMLALLFIGGLFVYNNFLFLGTDYWGKEGGYSRVQDRGPLNASAFEKVNATYATKDGRSAKLEQNGPTVNLLVYVPQGTDTGAARQFTEEVITNFLTELGDAKTPVAPYGQTFMKYEMSIIVTQSDMAKPDDATLDQIGDLAGQTNKIAYPFFGAIHKGVMTWTNNIT